MAKKLDDDAAFAYYVSLGEKRSYGQVARQFKVCPRAIRKASKRGDWIPRLERIEREAQERMDMSLVETRAEIKKRHLKMVRAVATRGLQVLQRHELERASEGVRAIDMAIRLERLLMGEPPENVGVSVAELTRREVETLVATPNEPEEPSNAEPE